MMANGFWAKLLLVMADGKAWFSRARRGRSRFMAKSTLETRVEETIDLAMAFPFVDFANHLWKIHVIMDLWIKHGQPLLIIVCWLF